MKLEEYNRLGNEEPNFDKKWTIDYPLKNIRLDEHNAQIRQKGTVLHMVPSIAEDMNIQGQLAPISGVSVLGDHTLLDPENDVITLKDGITRYSAAEQLGWETIKVSFYHQSLYGPEVNSTDWFWFQVTQNNHPPATNNTKQDVLFQIIKSVENGALDAKVGFAYLANKKGYVADANVHLKETYTNHGKDFILGCLEKALENKYLSSKNKTYTKQKDVEFFNAANPFSRNADIKAAGNSFDGEGEYADEEIVWFRADKKQRIEKDVLSYARNHKVSKPDVKVCISLSCSSVATKESEDIHDYRDDLVEHMRTVNDAALMAIMPSEENGLKAVKLVKFFDYAIVNPQVLGEENEHKFVDFIKL